MSGAEKRQSLPISDVAEPLVSVTDVKHYVYCPRLVYFDRVLHAQPVFGSQQEESQELHIEYVRKELRRKDAVYYSPEFVGAEKLLFVPLVSKSLQLQGVVDCIIKTVKGEYIPVEYKNMNSDKGKAYMDHKYQLVAYALLMEENFGTVVKRGFVNYVPEQLILKFEITPSMKSYVKRVVGHIKRIIREEMLPPIRVAQNKCQGGCGHKQTCQQN
ncbi:MAG: CRISPR-associated protein Cas4 [Candidatus Bathyarchaeia archaeon]|jgi:CRISPR-associated exonuclease Cas4|nr:CRISPR-associated protein Cas4 [Candidatus Bathyarchaeota archaeon A05DMB-3]